MKLPTTMLLNKIKGNFYNIAVFLYLLHMAVMANLTSFYPEVLMPFRMPSFLLVTGLVFLAIIQRAISKQLPKQPTAFYIAFIGVMLLGMLYNTENFNHIKSILFSGYFFKYVIIFSALFLFEDDPNRRVCQLIVIALAALLVYQLGLTTDAFLDEKGRLEYMTVGYGCAPWWVILTQGIFYFRKKSARLICLAGCIYFALFIMVYGNRGALLLIGLSLIFMMVAYLPLKKLIFIGTFGVVAILICVFSLEAILNFAGEYLGLDLSLSRNFRLLLSGQLSYDSGRLPIYEACFSSIVNNPFFGAGVGADRVLLDGSYAHNIILELCVAFGVIFGILLYGWLLYIGYQMIMKCTDRSWKALFLPFYTYSMIQLFFSGTLWESGYLVTSVIIYLIYKERCKKAVAPTMFVNTTNKHPIIDKESPLEYQRNLS